VASSGGNAGVAVAYTGRKLKIPTIIIVPKTTPEFMLNRIKAEGADVRVHGAVWDEADAYSRKLAEDEGATYIHPFDHPDLWEGNSSLIEELAAHSEFQKNPPDVVICSVGGGGLMSGICQGLEKAGWKDTTLVVSETTGANCLAAAIRNGGPVRVSVNSIAKSLAPSTVSTQAYEWTKRRKVENFEVEDASTVRTCISFLDDHRLLIEPACAASLVPIYEKTILDKFPQKPKSIVVILCGGSMTSLELLTQWRETFLKK